MKAAIGDWLGREITPRDGSFWSNWFGASNWSGKLVTQYTALQLSAVMGCVRLISETLSTLPVGLYVRKKDGSQDWVTDHQLYFLLHTQPNARMTAVVFWQAYVASLLLQGNAYVEKVYTGASRTTIAALNLLQPELVTFVLNSSGMMDWRYADPYTRQTRAIAPEDMWHLPAFTLDGIIGISPVRYGANVMGTAMATDQASADTFRHAMKSPGLVTMDAILRPEQRQDIREHVTKVTNEGGVMVLEKGSAFNQIAMNPNDAELLASRGYNVEEICFVPGTKIMTVDGFKEIEKIQPGELVLTHKGRWRPVRNAMQRSYAGSVVTVQAKGLNAVTSTENHPFYVQEIEVTREHRQIPVGKPRWIDAAKLRAPLINASGDKGRGSFHALTIPKIAHDETISFLDMAQWRSEPQRKGSMGQTEDVAFFNVNKFEKSVYAGTVYNLEVEEDESYTTEGGCVHNCRWFGVPPSMIGHGEKISNWGTGIEQQMIGFVTFVLRRWSVRIEQGIKKDLMTTVEKTSLSAEFALEGLMRGDSAARAAFYSTMVNNGVYTRDYCRQLENLPPMGGNAAVLTVQSAMLPIDKLGTQPPIAAAPMPDAPTPTPAPKSA